MRSLRSARLSASPPSNSPALMSTRCSSPTPLTVTVTAPPATVPSTVVSASWACALASCSCICWACPSSALRSRPPKGLSVMLVSLSLVADLFDDLGAQLPLEQLGAAEVVDVRVEVVRVRVGVRGAELLGGVVGRPSTRTGRLDGAPRGLDGATVQTALHGLFVRRLRRPGCVSCLRRLRRPRRRLDRPRRGVLHVRRRRGLLGSRARWCFGGLRRRRGRGGGTRRGGLDSGVDDRLDPPLSADHVHESLLEVRLVSACRVLLPQARGAEADGEGVALETDDL